MRVIVACEFSGTVRDAFIRYGAEAISCDLLPSEKPGPHIQDDIRNVDLTKFDLLIGHPPCTYLAVSGMRWFTDPRYSEDRISKRDVALDFFRYLLFAPCQRICIENPISVVSSFICKPTQIIQPFHFGENYTKKTCLWLKGLSKLSATKYIFGEKKSFHQMAPSPERSKNRSRTFPGIAEAMAEQWTRENRLW